MITNGPGLAQPTRAGTLGNPAGAAPASPRPLSTSSEIDRLGSRLASLYADRSAELEIISHQIDRARQLADRIGLAHYPQEGKDAALPDAIEAPGEPHPGTIAAIDYGHALHTDLHERIAMALANLAYEIGRLEAL